MDVDAGAAELTLERRSDWRAGERVVVTSSLLYQPPEEAVIASVSADGKKVTLAAPLRRKRTGASTSVPSTGAEVDLRARACLLSRTVAVAGGFNDTLDVAFSQGPNTVEYGWTLTAHGPMTWTHPVTFKTTTLPVAKVSVHHAALLGAGKIHSPVRRR